MVDSHTSLTFAQAFEDTEKELRNNIPPWEKADCLQKIAIMLIRLIILLPALVVIFIIISMYALYLAFYIYPLLNHQEKRPKVYYWHSDSEELNAFIRGIIFLCCINWCVFWLLVSLYRASYTDPGTIPRTPEWEMLCEDISETSTDKITIEKRKDGTLRTCNHCQLKKPDRCHHCKQCDRCNLKMDHHCNWIANCVGNNNYKYFFLVVFYATMSLGIFVGSFWETVVINLLDDDSSEILSLFLVSSYSLMFLLFLSVAAFLIFHVWLIYYNFTTIEFCEKKRRKDLNFIRSPYDCSRINNFKDALGNNPILWLLPFGYNKSKDSGLYFPINKIN
jgi:palmitoyltransferase ZDHHC2/15/20